MRVCIIFFLISLKCYGQHDSVIKEKAIYPKVAIAIKNHESNNEKSLLARKHNNIYGFKGGTRKIGRTSGKYSVYKNKTDSALDYLDFERKLVEKHNLNTREKYLRYISRIYASDKSWLRKVKKLII